MSVLVTLFALLVTLATVLAIEVARPASPARRVPPAERARAFRRLLDGSAQTARRRRCRSRPGGRGASAPAAACAKSLPTDPAW